MLDALVECSNAITNANASPPVSIGLTPGQFQQLRDELTQGNATLRSMWREDEHAVTLYLPAGALLVRMEEEE